MPQVRIKTATAVTQFPAGTLAGQWVFRLYASTPYSTLYVDDPLPPEVVFDNVAPGTYTLKIWRNTAAGLPMGGIYTHPEPIVVAAPPPAEIVMPVGATITVS